MKQATDSFISHISFLKGEVDKALRKLPLSREPDYLYKPMAYALKGQGKRLRPILLHLSGLTFKADPEALMKAGLAVELLHNFTLVHDDIMDSDELRHNQPAVHRKWDDATAILAGDGLFVLAQLLLCGLDAHIYRRFNEVTLLICQGQGLDKQYENDPAVNLKQYLEMISKKTGSLLGLCAELGGRLGSIEPEQIYKLYDYGLSLGLAFQIQDDILEIFGESKAMGKTLGSDMKSRKQTALTLLAREHDAKAWKKVNRLTVGMKNIEMLAMYRKYFESSGVYQEASELANKYINQAHDLLSVFPEPGRKNMMHFTNLILNRTF